MSVKFFKSLARLFKGYHVAHNMNPLIEEVGVKQNRAQRRAEEKFLKKKYKY